MIEQSDELIVDNLQNSRSNKWLRADGRRKRLVSCEQCGEEVERTDHCITYLLSGRFLIGLDDGTTVLSGLWLRQEEVADIVRSGVVNFFMVRSFELGLFVLGLWVRS